MRRARVVGLVSSSGTTRSSDAIWENPPLGYMKLNIEASFPSHLQLTGIGMCVPQGGRRQRDPCSH